MLAFATTRASSLFHAHAWAQLLEAACRLRQGQGVGHYTQRVRGNLMSWGENKNGRGKCVVTYLVTYGCAH